VTEDQRGAGRSRAARRSHHRHRSGRRRSLVAVAAAAAALALVGLLVHGLERLSDRAATAGARPAGPTVILEGEVDEPGPHPLADGATLCELWSAAGGDVDVEPGECDRPARTATRFRLEKGRFVVLDLTPEERFAVGLRLDLNQATEADLRAVPGLSEVLSGRVVEERTRGPYCTVDDLSRARGIGARKVEWLRPFLEVVGTPEGCDIDR